MFAPLLRLLSRLHRPAGLGLAALMVVMLCCFIYHREVNGSTGTPLLRGELACRDLLIQKGRRSAQRNDLVLLGYDQESLDLSKAWPEDIEASPALKAISGTQGRWPWPRSAQAAILERLAQAGAKAVVFDLVFAGPSPDDAQFRAVLDRYRHQVVIGATYNFSANQLSENKLVLPSPALIPSDQDPRIGYADYLTTRGMGGKISALSYRIATGDVARVADTPVFESLGARTLRQIGREDLIPADSLGKHYPFRYSRPFPSSSVYEILLEPFWQQNFHDGADFKDKIVLIGPMANVMQDSHPTPLGMMPGPEIHLHALAAMLNRDFLRLTTYWEDLGLIASAGLVAWLVGLVVRQPVPRTGALLLVGVAYVGLAFWLYNEFGVQLISFTPLLTLYVSGFGGVVGEYVIERAEKTRVRGVLDRLVSKDIVRELLRDRERYDALTRGERRCVTVLFSDVRGFTTLSEAAEDATAFIAQLNEYLGEMVDVVFRHKGTLDKFIGDAVMAVWGSMYTEGAEADARAAVAAAMEMHGRLAALNERWVREGRKAWNIGIGLNHGEAIVGGLGSEKSKMEITVIGDAVNLASRMEGLTKDYGLDLLIGESVARLVSETFRLRTVDLVRVKGKKKPAEVMAVLGPLSDVPSESQEILLADYEDAILLYRKQEFAAAARLLEECLNTDSEDKLAALYLGRCRDLLAEAPAPDWDGVRLMTTK